MIIDQIGVVRRDSVATIGMNHSKFVWRFSSNNEFSALKVLMVSKRNTYMFCL